MWAVSAFGRLTTVYLRPLRDLEIKLPSIVVSVNVRNGPGGRIRTRTGSGLSGVPLLLGYAGE